jgi:hypothetical protein
MQLEEMKSLWDEMSARVEKQKKLTDSVILKMARAEFRNKIGSIFLWELLGSIGCFAQVLFILFNFQKLNTTYLIICGAIAALILFLLPVLSIRAVNKIKSLRIMENNYKESLLEYSKRKVQFVFVQKLSFYLGAILLLVILPVMGKLIAEKDLFKETWLWMWYALSFPFFYFFTRWVFKYYMRSVKDAENILMELKE